MDSVVSIMRFIKTKQERKSKIRKQHYGGITMRDWMDLDGDGRIDGAERMHAHEMLCSSREEHEALFGYAGDFHKSIDEDDDFELDAMIAGLDIDELEDMDPDERAEVLEEAGLDAEDYDFY